MNVERVLGAVYNVLTSRGNLSILGCLKVEGTSQPYLTYFDTEFDALVNDISGTLNFVL